MRWDFQHEEKEISFLSKNFSVIMNGQYRLKKKKQQKSKIITLITQKLMFTLKTTVKR